MDEIRNEHVEKLESSCNISQAGVTPLDLAKEKMPSLVRSMSDGNKELCFIISEDG